LSDIVTSYLPGWADTRAWVLARPLTGFAETFSQMILEVAPGGGATTPEPDPRAEGVYFVVSGELHLTIDGKTHTLKPGAFAYLPPGTAYKIAGAGDEPATCHWIRKEFEPVDGLGLPTVLISDERDIEPTSMPDTDGRWATTRFVDPNDMRHDMHVTIVTLQPGAVIPFPETHVMEHGLYVLEGKAVYRLNQDWVEVEAGDFITHVDGEGLLGLTLDEAVELMRGPVGSEIIITVVREGEDDPFDITIIRDTIRLTAVRTRTEGDAVVLRVSTFNDQTYPNLREGLAEQIEDAGGKDNVSGVVIDLRNNPGGLLTAAVRVSDAFLTAGEIVSTRGRDPQDAERFNASPDDLAEGLPIVVLINGGSASASEIVAGALQDHQRAIVVGTKSFGKGSVQSIMPLRGSGAMRLTTARYYTPSGRSIQALGISPDIIVEQPRRTPESKEEEEARATRSEADLRGSLGNDSLTEDQRRQIEEERAIAEATAELREEDYQLAYAIDILKGLNALNGQ
ncbi:MAG: (S)-ureidoglycine aminohydrolase, partial [Pseudomonadota bacterium]